MAEIDLRFGTEVQQLEVIHSFLTESYWSSGIPKALVARALANSLCVGAFEGAAQIGFARVVTDRATFAYLADVFVLETHRGRGIARALVAALHDHRELQGLRRWLLATRDAHGLYGSMGWEPLSDSSVFLQRYDPDAYRRGEP